MVSYDSNLPDRRIFISTAVVGVNGLGHRILCHRLYQSLADISKRVFDVFEKMNFSAFKMERANTDRSPIVYSVKELLSMKRPEGCSWSCLSFAELNRPERREEADSMLAYQVARRRLFSLPREKLVSLMKTPETLFHLDSVQIRSIDKETTSPNPTFTQFVWAREMV